MDFADPPNDDSKSDLVDLSVRSGNPPPGLGVKASAIGAPAIGTPTPDTLKLTPKSDIDHCNPPLSEPETGG